MLASVRSALLLIAALTATIIAPAQAGPSSEPLVRVATATLPQVAVSQLIDPQGTPTLAAPAVDEVPETPTSVEPAVPATADLGDMVAQYRAADSGSRELDCLATGIYFESKSEPLAGQLAVGKVIANRAASRGRFPPTYCGVLFQRGQFSFIHGRALPRVPRASHQWQTAVAIAKIVDQGLKTSAVADALYFHARYVSPGWRMKRVASIGNHVFYR